MQYFDYLHDDYIETIQVTCIYRMRFLVTVCLIYQLIEAVWRIHT